MRQLKAFASQSTSECGMKKHGIKGVVHLLIPQQWHPLSALGLQLFAAA
jgi:hypothetical protein